MHEDHRGLARRVRRFDLLVLVLGDVDHVVLLSGGVNIVRDA
jgi:hypothetical protein